MINPAMVRGNVNSFIGRFKLNGRAKDSFIAGNDMKNEQGGNDVNNIIADAYARGISGCQLGRGVQDSGEARC